MHGSVIRLHVVVLLVVVVISVVVILVFVVVKVVVVIVVMLVVVVVAVSAAEFSLESASFNLSDSGDSDQRSSADDGAKHCSLPVRWFSLSG